MTTQYYNRHFDEPRTEQSEVWGTCEYYFETNQEGEVLRQIEVYENGKKVKQSKKYDPDVWIKKLKNCNGIKTEAQERLAYLYKK